MLKSAQTLLSIAEIRLKKAQSRIQVLREKYNREKEEFSQLIQVSKLLSIEHENRRAKIREFLTTQTTSVADVSIATLREEQIQMESKSMEQALFEKKDMLKASEVRLFQAEEAYAELESTKGKRAEILKTFIKKRRQELEKRAETEMEDLSSVRSAYNFKNRDSA